MHSTHSVLPRAKQNKIKHFFFVRISFSSRLIFPNFIFFFVLNANHLWSNLKRAQKKIFFFVSTQAREKSLPFQTNVSIRLSINLFKFTIKYWNILFFICIWVFFLYYYSIYTQYLFIYYTYIKRDLYRKVLKKLIHLSSFTDTCRDSLHFSCFVKGRHIKTYIK